PGDSHTSDTDPASESTPEVLDAEPVDPTETGTQDTAENSARPPTALDRRSWAGRPVLPAWLHDRTQFVATVRWWTTHTAHTVASPAVRLPLSAGRLLAASPRGASRAIGAWWRWVFDTEATPLRRQTVERLEADTYIILSRQRNVRVRARLRFSAAVTGLAAVALLVGILAWPRAVQLGGLVGAGVLGWVGRRQDRPIITPATLTQAVRKLTPDVVIRAFISAGLCREPDPVTFAQPIQRDGRGWLAVVDLPYGRHYAQAAGK